MCVLVRRRHCALYIALVLLLRRADRGSESAQVLAAASSVLLTEQRYRTWPGYATLADLGLHHYHRRIPDLALQLLHS